MAKFESQKVEICVHRNLSVFSFSWGVSRGVYFIHGEVKGGGTLLGCSSFVQTTVVRCKRGKGAGGGLTLCFIVVVLVIGGLFLRCV